MRRGYRLERSVATFRIRRIVYRWKGVGGATMAGKCGEHISRILSRDGRRGIPPFFEG